MSTHERNFSLLLVPGIVLLLLNCCFVYLLKALFLITDHIPFSITHCRFGGYYGIHYLS